MKVSVCIPTYNSEAYLESCIRSVLRQSDVDFEIVVADNASQDHTWEIVQSFSDARIRAFRSDENRGMSANFNRALSESRGEYVKLLCYDDFLEPGALRAQTRSLDEQSDLSMVTSGTIIIDSQDREIDRVIWFADPVKVSSPELQMIALIYGNVVGEPSAVLFRRDAWLDAGPFRPGLVTLIDLDMWFRLTVQGPLGYFPEPLCRIRRHKLSMTNQFRGAGEVQEAVLRMTESLLSELRASALARKVCLGKVAGSHLKHALYGLKAGYVKWPAEALCAAFRIDPFFLGLASYSLLFRPGVLGLRIKKNSGLALAAANTLRRLAET